MIGLGVFIASLGAAHGLNAYSPPDVFAYPKFGVQINSIPILNDTVAELMTPSDSMQHLMTTPGGRRFLCSVPIPHSVVNVPKNQQSDELMEEQGLLKGLELLDSLKNTCMYLKQGYFTYSFCYPLHVKQFHEIMGSSSDNGPIEDPTTDSYVLGEAPPPQSTDLVKRPHIPSTLGGRNVLGAGWIDGGRYVSQQWSGGTLCDKTGRERSIEIQFHCNIHTSGKIALVRETSICTYVMLIHTPALCEEPLFMEGNTDEEEPEETIDCKEILTAEEMNVRLAKDDQERAAISAAEKETQTQESDPGVDVEAEREPDNVEKGEMIETKPTVDTQEQQQKGKPKVNFISIDPDSEAEWSKVLGNLLKKYLGDDVEIESLSTLQPDQIKGFEEEPRPGDEGFHNLQKMWKAKGVNPKEYAEQVKILAEKRAQVFETRDTQPWHLTSTKKDKLGQLGEEKGKKKHDEL